MEITHNSRMQLDATKSRAADAVVMSQVGCQTLIRDQQTLAR